MDEIGTSAVLTIPDGYYALDSEWRFIELDHAAEKHFGRSAQELIGRNVWTETGTPPDSPVYTTFCEAVARRQRIRFEVESGIRPGLWFELHAHPRSTGGLDVYFHEVTERKRAEAALRDSEARYRTLHETLRDAFVQVSLDGRLLEFNDAYCQMLGYSPDELRRLTYQDLTPQPWHQMEEQIVREQIVARGYSDVYQKEYRRKDGSVFPVELRTVLSRDASGRPCGMWGIVRDITARKHGEEVLRRQAQLLDLSSDAIFVWGIGGAIEYWNEGAWRLYGYSREEALGRVSHELLATVHPRGRAAFLAELEGAGYWRGELKHRAKDGHIVTVESSHQLIRQDDRTLVLETTRDITDRKRAEEALRASEERFRVAQELSPDGFILLHPERDAHGHVEDFTWIYENAAVARMNGTDPRQIVGRRLLDTFPANAGTRFFEAYRRVAQTGEPAVVEDSYEAETISPRTWFRVAVVRTGEDIAVLVQDVTSRKQAEAASRQLNLELEQRVSARTAELFEASERLRAERQRFLGLLEHMPVIVTLLRPDYRVEWVNQAYRDALGDNVGRLCYASQFGRDRPCDECQAFIPLRTGKPQHWEWTLPNGRTFDIHNIPFTDSDGSRMILEVDIDITERRQAELALKELNEALEQRVSERTEALDQSQQRLQLAMDAVREANEKLTEADRRKDEFIALLSHELRNPVAPIRYALPILHAQRLDDFGNRAAAVVKRQTDQLTRLLDDLLDVGRITSGKLALRPEQVTLRSVVTAAIETATPALSAAHHVLNINITPERVWLNADPARLGQVLTNLLDNSAKFTPSGGEITLEATREGDQAVVRVRDGGMGIPPADLPRIFQMFRQAGDAGRPNGGLGIGLAIAKRLVEMHSGTIEAFSSGIGHGAEFVVRLPVAPEGRPQESARAPDRAIGRTLKVLVVDDNQDLVEMLSLVVETGGHEVQKAFDGPEAISIARSYRPDVVLLDLGLPAMHGIEVARELRADPTTENARLIALTGWGQAEDRERTRAAGFHYHLTKPTEPEELQQLLEAIAAEAPY